VAFLPNGHQCNQWLTALTAELEDAEGETRKTTRSGNDPAGKRSARCRESVGNRHERRCRTPINPPKRSAMTPPTRPNRAEPTVAPPPATAQTARKGRLNFLYSSKPVAAGAEVGAGSVAGGARVGLGGLRSSAPRDSRATVRCIFSTSLTRGRSQPKRPSVESAS